MCVCGLTILFDLFTFIFISSNGIPNHRDSLHFQSPASDDSILHSIMGSPGGFASWTARLGLTVNMLGTSFIVCSLVLTVTFLTMLCLQSRLVWI